MNSNTQGYCPAYTAAVMIFVLYGLPHSEVLCYSIYITVIVLHMKIWAFVTKRSKYRPKTGKTPSGTSKWLWVVSHISTALLKLNKQVKIQWSWVIMNVSLLGIGECTVGISTWLYYVHVMHFYLNHNYIIMQWSLKRPIECQLRLQVRKHA